MMKKMQKGFTLVELAVVISIIGILVAVAVPKYVDMTTNANAKKELATAGSIRSAHTMLKSSANGVNPTVTQLTAGVTLAGYTQPATPPSNGICIAEDRMVRTYTDDAGTVGTNAVTDRVGAVGAVDDNATC